LRGINADPWKYFSYKARFRNEEQCRIIQRMINNQNSAASLDFLGSFH
jgi:hypothetical protein